MSKDQQDSVTWIKDSMNILNYVAAASLYLKDNYLLERPLEVTDIKDRILGHWGTVPGLNLIYLALSNVIKNNTNSNDQSLLITGPGHGAPSVLAGSWLDDSLADLYDGKYARNIAGVSQLIHDFSWPGNSYGQFQSHITPHIPGSIHEGGELGYSLGIAYGTVMDNPNLTTYCVIGDGESETGTLSASWHSNKFINPKFDGAVLPILHLNGYKISGPTILGTYSNQALEELFHGLGYLPYIVDQYESENFELDVITTFNQAHEEIKRVKDTWTEGKIPYWPMIIFKSKKGWTGPKTAHGKMIEDNNLSHGIPLKNPKSDIEQLVLLEQWLKSYNIQAYFDDHTNLISPISDQLPEFNQRLSQSPYSNLKSQSLKLPKITEFDNESNGRGSQSGNVLITCSDLLSKIVQLNPNSFRVFSPDESESNKLESLMEISTRAYEWPTRPQDEYIKSKGQILEILSEQVLQCWYQGYALTGRHGIFISYESFFDIISSQIDQYIKFRKTQQTLPWRNSADGMTYLATSTLWRQEHNGFTHQNPSLIQSLLAKQTERVSLFFPISANTLLATIHECFVNDSYVNYITAGKTDFPQWLTLEESMTAVREGSMTWDWVSDANPDIVFVTIGDYQHQETMAGIELLQTLIPSVKIRLVNVQRMTPVGIPGLITQDDITHKLTSNKPIIVNFHGYPEAIKQLFFGSEVSKNMTILGYREMGSTTTPFNMQVLNQTSRFHVALFAAQKLSSYKKIMQSECLKVELYIEQMLEKHDAYIHEYGDDLPEIKNWKPNSK